MSQLNEQLHSMIGELVKLGRGGPGDAQGYLVAVKEDYLSLLNKEGALVHYPFRHLKSVSVSQEENARQQVTPDDIESLQEALPDRFWDLMGLLHGRKIQVYDHGPECASGFLFQCGSDFIKLVTSPDEMIHYPAFHIRSVSLARNRSKQQQDDDEQETQDDDEQQAQDNQQTQANSNPAAKADSNHKGGQDRQAKHPGPTVKQFGQARTTNVALKKYGGIWTASSFTTSPSQKAVEVQHSE